jgi:hypothetical protein
MAEPCPDLDELAVALALEFRDVDVIRTLTGLDVISRCLEPSTYALPPLDQCLRCGSFLAGRLGLRVHSEATPDAYLIDAVVERRAGSELVVAVVACELARRAGVPLRPAAAPSRFLIAHAQSEPTIVIDPARGYRVLAPEELPSGLRWICPHEVGYALVTALSRSYERTGCLAEAITAAHLAAGINATGCFRDEIDARLRSLRARLN